MKVFVDTSAFLAVLNADDDFHSEQGFEVLGLKLQ